MELHAKLVRAQLNFFKPFVANCSLDVTRKGQDKLGELMTAIHKREVYVREHDFGGFQGAWLTPKDKRRTGVVLYLHGGGYTCGNLEYAKGFAATLADECGVRVFCAAYRLAPEDSFPAALDDAVVSYQYLLSKGYGPSQILLCGESAGGGLCYALCLRLKQLKLPLPCGIIAISPWTDLTQSGATFDENRDNDPSLSKELLDFYSACYTRTPKIRSARRFLATSRTCRRRFFSRAGMRFCWTTRSGFTRSCWTQAAKVGSTSRPSAGTRTCSTAWRKTCRTISSPSITF